MYAKMRGTAGGIAVVTLIVAVAVLAAACGAADETTTTVAPETTAPPTTVAETTTTTAVATSAFEGDAALVAANWEAFMDPATPTADKIGLLENGAAHQAELEALAANPAAAAATVTVTGVELTSATTAEVTFDVIVGGATVMTGQTGTAVLEDGTWKVTESAFAGMLAAQGSV